MDRNKTAAAVRKIIRESHSSLMKLQADHRAELIAQEDANDMRLKEALREIVGVSEKNESNRQELLTQAAVTGVESNVLFLVAELIYRQDRLRRQLLDGDAEALKKKAIVDVNSGYGSGFAHLWLKLSTLSAASASQELKLLLTPFVANGTIPAVTITGARDAGEGTSYRVVSIPII